MTMSVNTNVFESVKGAYNVFSSSANNFFNRVKENLKNENGEAPQSLKGRVTNFLKNGNPIDITIIALVALSGVVLAAGTLLYLAGPVLLTLALGATSLGFAYALLKKD